MNSQQDFPPHLKHVGIPCETSAADTFDFQQVPDGGGVCVCGRVEIGQNEPDIRRTLDED